MPILLFFLLVLGISAVTAMPQAKAELEYWEFGSWKARVFDCGDWYQKYYALDLQDRLGDWPEDIWRAAREEGINEEQIATMEKEFSRGRKWAWENGWRRSRVVLRQSFFIDRFVKNVERRRRYCFFEQR